MFFSVLSCWFLLKSLQSYNERYFSKSLFACFFVSNLLATGFYEPAMAANFIITFFILFVNRHKIYVHKFFTWSVPFATTFFMIVFYALAMPFGHGATRSDTVSFGELPLHALQVTGRVLRLFTHTQYDIFRYSFVSGMRTVFASHVGLVSLVLVCVFTFFVFVWVNQNKVTIGAAQKGIEVSGFYTMRLVFGGLIVLATFSPYYLLAPVYIPARTIYPAIFGFALFLDTLLEIIANLGVLSVIKPIATAIIIVPFFVSYVGELNNFRLVSNTDAVIEGIFLQFAQTLDAYEIENWYHGLVFVNMPSLAVEISFGGRDRKSVV
jgi:hypothetical protein